jgi:hypothetical protein
LIEINFFYNEKKTKKKIKRIKNQKRHRNQKALKNQKFTKKEFEILEKNQRKLKQRP